MPSSSSTQHTQTHVGVPAERTPLERRVALVPDAVRQLVTRGIAVIVETGAGSGARISDAQYVAAGATIGDAWSADLVVKVSPPTAEEIARLTPSSTYVGLLDPRGAPATTTALAAAGVTAFALEAIPRTSRAQAMDALSSQSAVTGYEAVLLAASQSIRFFPMLTTAAGTVPPADVLVLGVGVAGLQALATARRLGARTTGFDVRPEVAEQVRSVGAMWLELVGADAVGDGGYARALDADERAAQLVALAEALPRFDVVITTALVPGAPAPRLVTADAVSHMRAGSVIVDLAAATGGNCELTQVDATIVRHDVTICGPTDLASRLPEHASQLFARNVVALLDLLVDEHGALAPDFDDDIVAAACVARAPTPDVTHVSTEAPT
ncbi:MAG: Re/Si-specific NAD(P)(+) transhydrogenase subunit alpha [Thermoleophilia bacterium]|nr:Re/Si-specific NAD(P)(+) transhydrogenase subunit alpha [Thermoleophilia bacterium]